MNEKCSIVIVVLNDFYQLECGVFIDKSWREQNQYIQQFKSNNQIDIKKVNVSKMEDRNINNNNNNQDWRINLTRLIMFVKRRIKLNRFFLVIDTKKGVTISAITVIVSTFNNIFTSIN